MDARRQFRVFVDLDRLRANLARQDGRDASDEDVRSFLADAGFQKLRTIPAPNVYVADAAALAHLEPDEMRSVHPLGDAPDARQTFEAAREALQHRKFSLTPYAAW